jgi:hypothetical protein
MNTERIVFGLILLGVGALTGAAAVQEHRARRRRLAQWRRVFGTVVQTRETTASNSYSTTEYLLRFTTESGVTIESWQTTSERLAVGGPVQLLHDPANPKDVELSSSGGHVGGMMMLAFFTVLLVSAAVGLLTTASRP